MARQSICNQCGTISSGKTITKGNILLEVVLWCMLLVPGLIYTIWRHLTRYKGCRECGSAELVPLESPRGARLQRDYHGD